MSCICSILGLSFKKGLAKLNLNSVEQMVKCFSIFPSSVVDSLKQLKADVLVQFSRTFLSHLFIYSLIEPDRRIKTACISDRMSRLIAAMTDINVHIYVTLCYVIIKPKFPTSNHLTQLTAQLELSDLHHDNNNFIVHSIWSLGLL